MSKFAAILTTSRGEAAQPSLTASDSHSVTARQLLVFEPAFHAETADAKYACLEMISRRDAIENCDGGWRKLVPAFVGIVQPSQINEASGVDRGHAASDSRRSTVQDALRPRPMPHVTWCEGQGSNLTEAGTAPGLASPIRSCPSAAIRCLPRSVAKNSCGAELCLLSTVCSEPNTSGIHIRGPLREIRCHSSLAPAAALDGACIHDAPSFFDSRKFRVTCTSALTNARAGRSVPSPPGARGGHHRIGNPSRTLTGLLSQYESADGGKERLTIPRFFREPDGCNRYRFSTRAAAGLHPSFALLSPPGCSGIACQSSPLSQLSGNPGEIA